MNETSHMVGVNANGVERGPNPERMLQSLGHPVATVVEALIKDCRSGKLKGLTHYKAAYGLAIQIPCLDPYLESTTEKLTAMDVISAIHQLGWLTDIPNLNTDECYRVIGHRPQLLSLEVKFDTNFIPCFLISTNIAKALGFVEYVNSISPKEYPLREIVDYMSIMDRPRAIGNIYAYVRGDDGFLKQMLGGRSGHSELEMAIEQGTVDQFEMVLFDGGDVSGTRWKQVFFPRDKSGFFVDKNSAGKPPMVPSPPLVKYWNEYGVRPTCYRESLNVTSSLQMYEQFRLDCLNGIFNERVRFNPEYGMIIHESCIHDIEDHFRLDGLLQILSERRVISGFPAVDFDLTHKDIHGDRCIFIPAETAICFGFAPALKDTASTINPILNEASTIVVQRDGSADVKFNGLLKTEVSSKSQKANKRWTVLRLYQSNKGTFVCQELGCSIEVGEAERSKVAVCKREDEVIAFFGKGWLAKLLYKGADIECVELVE